MVYRSLEYLVLDSFFLCSVFVFFFFQAEDGIRYLVRSRGLGDVYKRQVVRYLEGRGGEGENGLAQSPISQSPISQSLLFTSCLLYTSDAADERSSVDLGGRRIIKKKKHGNYRCSRDSTKSV